MSSSTINTEITISLYREYKSMYKVAKIMNTSGYMVRKCLMKAGIELNSSDHNTKYPLKDPHCLDNIDCEWKAYFLGFFCADGCMGSDRNSLSITLQESDGYILEKFAQLFYVDSFSLYKRIINRQNCQNQISLRVYNRHLYQSMLNLNITPRKTFALQFPKIPEHLLHHFIRGYFDGDGSITKGKMESRSKEFLMSIVGNDNFIKSLHSILSERGISGRVSPCATSKGISIFTLTSKIEMVKFQKLIYQDARIYLNRKFDTFLAMEQSVTNFPERYRKSKYKFIRYTRRRKDHFYFVGVDKKRIYFATEQEAFEARQKYLLDCQNPMNSSPLL